jgi:chemotaxis protein histidine kinase CheA
MNLSRLISIIFISLLLTLLSACTRHIYGVQEEDWQRLNESERADIILAYQERRLHEERRRAAEEEMRAREMTRQQRAYPEIIYLRLSGGSFYFQGRPYHYHQHALQLMHGETRALTLISMDDQPAHRITLWVRYLNGDVMLGDGQHFLHTLNYRETWHQGDHYKGINLRGGIHLDDMELSIGPKPFNQPPNRNRHAPDCYGKACVESQDEVYQQGHEIGDKERKRASDEMRYAPRVETERLKQERIQQEKAQQEKAQQEKAQQEKAQQEKAQQEKAQQEKAQQEKAQQEKAQQEKAQQEKAQQEKAQQEKAQQEKAQQEKAQQEKAQRKMARQEKAQQKKAQRENAQQEKAQQEKAQQEKAQQEKAQQEKAQQEKAQQEKAQQEKAQQNKAQREKARQEKAQQDKAQREKARQEKAQQEKSKSKDADTDECVARDENSANGKGDLPFCNE